MGGHREERPGGLRWRLGVAVLLGATAAAVGGVELFLRWFAPVSYRSAGTAHGGFVRVHRPSEIPGLEYEIAPGCAVPMPTWGEGVVVHANAFGMRGPETTLAKPPGVVRVAAVGDSFTFGQGVEDADTFPRQLERELQASGKGRYEVQNFGVAGYATADEAVVIRERVLAFAPDVIVIGYVVNDPEVHPSHPLHMAFHRPRAWERSHLLRLLAERLRERAEARHPSGFHYLHAVEGPHWPTVPAAFEDIRASTTAAGVPVVVVLMPLLGGRTWSSYRFADLHAQVARAARRAGFPTLVLARPLAGLVARPLDLRLEDDGHANARGNALFASLTRRFLEEKHPELFAASR